MYAVVQCPTCHWARGVQRKAKSSTCPRCSRRFSLEGTVFLAHAADSRRLADEVARVNASSPPGGTIAAKASIEVEVGSPRAHDGPSARERVRGALLAIAANEITMEAMDRFLSGKGLDEKIWRQELKRLIAQNLLYEPRPGRFRRS